jgi:CBS domain-containing protein
MGRLVKHILEQKGREVVTIESDATVYACLEAMVERNVGSIVVLDEGEVSGIFTERDYLRRIALEGRTSRQTRVCDVMTSEVIVTTPERTIRECLAVMTEAKCRHLPVVAEGRLAGIVSIGDCVKHTSEAAREEVVHLQRYIQTHIIGRYPA